MSNPKLNKSGCKDLTAYQAIKNVEKFERDEVATKVIKAIKIVAEIWGFKISNRIYLTDIKTNKEYK